MRLPVDSLKASIGDLPINKIRMDIYIWRDHGRNKWDKRRKGRGGGKEKKEKIMGREKGKRMNKERITVFDRAEKLSWLG